MGNIILIFYCVVSLLLELSNAANLVLANYTFVRNECIQRDFKDHSNKKLLGGLLSSTTSGSCLLSDGVSSGNKWYSSDNVSGLKSLIGANGFTIELWIQPKLSISSNSGILSFGIDSLSGSQCANNLLLSQIPTTSGLVNNAGFQISLCDQTVTTGKKLISQTTQIQTFSGVPALMHVVVAVSFTSNMLAAGSNIFKVYSNFTLNGASMPTASSYQSLETTFNTTSWDSSGGLNIFPTLDLLGGSNSVAAGNIYFLAIYDEILSHKEILARFHTSLPNSLPFVANKTVWIQENGQVGDHSTDPSYYTNTIPVSELATISLSAYDLDSQPISPNYNALTSYEMGIYITSLPAVATGGLFYYMNGTVLPLPPATTSSSSLAVNIHIPYDTVTSSYAVRYRPPLNQYSATYVHFDKSNYRNLDPVTGLPSAETAWVSIVVEHVYRPPVAAAATSSVSAKVLTTLTLTGNGFDSTLVSVCIKNLPTNGQLYSVSSKGVVSSSALTSSSILAGGYVITTSPFQIAYQYSGSEVPLSSSSSSSVVGSDSFNFTVINNQSMQSLSAKYSITAFSALLAVPTNTSAASPNAVEIANSVIKIGGKDTSSLSRSLHAVITSLPLYGTLYYNTSSASSSSTTTTTAKSSLVAIAVGTQLPSTVLSTNKYAGRFPVVYKGNAYYFTTPTVTWNGTLLFPGTADFFQFKVTSATSGDTAQSAIVTQYVQVKNVNDATVITFNYKDSSGKTNNNNKIEVYAVSNIASGSSIAIHGFNVIDYDRGVDVIRATITTSSSTSSITLNQDVFALLDFNSAKYCYSSSTWQCQQNLHSSSGMTFVAAPSVIAAALNGLVYENVRPNLVDNVTVTLYDGSGGLCLPNKQLGTGSIRSGCLVTSVMFQVTVLGYVGAATAANAASMSGTNSSLSSSLKYVAIGLLVCISMIACRCLCCGKTKKSHSNRSCCKKSRKRRSNSDDTDDSEEEEEEDYDKYNEVDDDEETGRRKRGGGGGGNDGSKQTKSSGNNIYSMIANKSMVVQAAKTLYEALPTLSPPRNSLSLSPLKDRKERNKEDDSLAAVEKQQYNHHHHRNGTAITTNTAVSNKTSLGNKNYSPRSNNRKKLYGNNNKHPNPLDYHNTKRGSSISNSTTHQAAPNITIITYTEPYDVVHGTSPSRSLLISGLDTTTTAANTTNSTSRRNTAANTTTTHHIKIPTSPRAATTTINRSSTNTGGKSSPRKATATTVATTTTPTRNYHNKNSNYRNIGGGDDNNDEDDDDVDDNMAPLSISNTKISKRTLDKKTTLNVVKTNNSSSSNSLKKKTTAKESAAITKTNVEKSRYNEENDRRIHKNIHKSKSQSNINSNNRILTSSSNISCSSKTKKKLSIKLIDVGNKSKLLSRGYSNNSTNGSNKITTQLSNKVVKSKHKHRKDYNDDYNDEQVKYSESLSPDPLKTPPARHHNNKSNSDSSRSPVPTRLFFPDCVQSSPTNSTTTTTVPYCHNNNSSGNNIKNNLSSSLFGGYHAVNTTSASPCSPPPTSKLDISNNLKYRSNRKEGKVVDDDDDISNKKSGVVWTTHEHKSGRLYYYNKHTKQSTWKKPEMLL